MKRLPGDYVAGFVDGEGCFYINFRRDIRHDRKNKPVYFYWKVGFAIVLRADDREILEKIKQSLDCGTVTINKRGQARLQMTDVNDLTKVADFFDRHPLRAKKRFDYLLWKEALLILKRNKQERKPGDKGFSKINWNKGDLERLRQIKVEMEQYKSTGPQWKWISNTIK